MRMISAWGEPWPISIRQGATQKHGEAAFAGVTVQPMIRDKGIELILGMTHDAQFFHYRGLRDADGVLSAVVGCFIRGGVLTTPIVGYDTTRPARDGLYRIASVMLAQMAIEHGCKLNGSAGAASFKRNRGARPVIEYTAYFVGHLSFARRTTFGAIEQVLNKMAVPVMVERGL